MGSSAPDDRIADLRRRLRAAEAELAAETAAREEQEKLARTMARAARTEAAEGEALAKEVAELRALLQAQEDKRTATTRSAESHREKAHADRAGFQESVNAEAEKRIAPELKRRLAEARAAWDEERKRERARLAETAKNETEQRLAAADAAWRATRENALAEAIAAREDEEAQRLTAARAEWEREHDAAMADSERHWRERLDREIKETREAMEKAWARTEEGSGIPTGPGLRNMRETLNAAAHRRRLFGYRITVVVLLLVIAGAFVFREPLWGEKPDFAGELDTPLSDRTVNAERRTAPDKPKGTKRSVATEAPKPPLDASKPTKAKVSASTHPASSARTRKLEAEISAMRTRLEAEEKRANEAEYKAAKANAARKRVKAETRRARQAEKKAQAKAVTGLKTEIQELRKKLEAANAAASAIQAAE